MLADGYDIVLDLEKSRGRRLWDARRNRSYLDLFSFFATLPLGLNHPKLADGAFRAKLLRAALANPSNSDIYTTEMADFVETFARVGIPPTLPYAFFVSGGTLGVERAGCDGPEGPPQLPQGTPGGKGAPDPPLPLGVPRPLGLHDVDDEHRRSAQDAVLPQVQE
jgi:hypothetical protein